MCRLTCESLDALLEEIIDSVEMTDDRDEQFILVQTVLEDNGIVEIVD